jgi:hypothetical protein
VTAADRRSAGRPPRDQPRRGRRRRLILACALAGIIAIAMTAEGATRHIIDDRFAAAADRALTGPVSVGIGLTPALLDAVSGQIPGVTITAPATSVCGLRDIDVTVTLGDVRREHHVVTVQGATASIVIPPAALTGQFAGRYPNASVAPDPGASSLVIHLGPAGAVSVLERASLSGRTITLSPASVSVLGHPITITARISDRLTVRRALSRLPLGLVPTSLSVTGGGLQVSLAGGPAAIKDTAGARTGCPVTTPS